MAATKPDLPSVVQGAVRQFSELSGQTPEQVSGVRTTDDGWSVLVEVVDVERVPPTTSVMSTYRIDVDGDARLTGYERLRRYTRSSTGRTEMTTVVSRGPDSLADVLERVLDKGVVIVGDISVTLLDIELLTLKVRLLVASVDTAKRMGIDWWTSDPFLTSAARHDEEEREQLRARIRELEARASAGGST